MFEKLKKTCKVSSLHYKSYATTATIPARDWNCISKDHFFLSLTYLRAIEDSLSRTIDFKYLIFYSEKTPVAIAATQLLKFNTTEITLAEFPFTISETLGNKIIQNLDVSVLVCGSLFSCGEHGFAFSDQITAKDAYGLLAKTLRELRKNESEDKPSFLLLKEFWPASTIESDALLNQKFRPVHIDVNMVLSMQASWHSFEEYLASMKTKFRTRAKKVLSSSEELEVKDFTHHTIAEHKDQINKLYLSVIENADFKVAQLSADTFRIVKEALGDTYVFKGYFLKGELVGFSTAFILNDAIEANHIGVNYSYNVSHAIYQRMLYDYVDLAIKKQVKSLRLGRTAELIKSSVGAEAVEMRLYVRHGNTISNKLLKPMVSLVQPSAYEIRTPFKKQART